LSNFALPGEAAFPLGGMVTAPANRGEADQLKAYLTQARQELGIRLVDMVYKGTDGRQPNKWWAQFAKRKIFRYGAKVRPLHHCVTQKNC